MGHECDICGEEFDSERGLHVHQSQKHGDENNTTTPSSKLDGITLTTKQFGAAALAFGLLIGLALGGLGGATAAGMIQDSTQAAPANPDTGDTGTTGDADPGSTGESQNADTQSYVNVSKIDLEGEPVLGQEDAPVTMVVYEDFECPFCKRFEKGAVQQIKSKYINSGKVKLVWKDFPLANIHPWAQPAAKTMECVYRQDNDAFWTLKEKIFSNQNQISTSNVEDKLISWASEEGVSESAVRSCLENGNPGEEVQSDMREGQGFDTVISTPRGNRPFVSGTPGSVIFAKGEEKGEPVVGAQPFSAFQQIIDSKLNN